MLGNWWGIIQYLLLPNDIVWRRLDQKEREYILQANTLHNVERDDYKQPKKYGQGRIAGGENWDSAADRLSTIRGKILAQILKETWPSSVIELGPGAGFFSRLICETPAVNDYVAVDIGRAFLDYLQPRLAAVTAKKHFQYDLVCADFLKLSFPARFDAIILLSTVHHIPNRDELFAHVRHWLKPGGIIVAMDPTHYLPRLLHLSKKILFRGYGRRSYWSDQANLSTHHMCSYREYKRLARRHGFVIDQEWYIYPKKHLAAGHSPWRWLATEMAVVLRKPPVQEAQTYKSLCTDL
ncbi:MAG: methyltransferase [Candidatus Magasanikbacteria bacterium]|nr:methyltransferase [Candidatus Magasanikbacteria bacterium]